RAEQTIPLIPDHEVLRVIGRGAYGEIWLARSLTGALRAVKVVQRNTFENDRAFQREFQGMCSFEPISRAHDGFVDILHVGQTGAYLYYIMELADDHLAGRAIDVLHYAPRTLKSEIDRHRRLSADECVRLGICLTDALATLHAHGLTHRDVKPANIIFVEEKPKLADIGLVAVSGQRSFVGTEGYVQPEGPGTPQADIYSLGKVLYELSMGKDRLDFPELDTRLGEQPDKERLLQLNDVLLKACANEATRRYRSAGEMHDELAALGSAPARSRGWGLVSLGGALVVLLLAGLIWFLVQQRPRSAVATPDAVARVTITTEPAGAMVLLGDQMKKSPATFTELEPRRYGLRVMLPGYDPIETKLSLAGQESLDFPLVRLERSKGTLAIETEPSGAALRIEDERGELVRAGPAPLEIADLPTGKYEIIAQRDAWQLRETIEVKRAATARVTLAFVAVPLEIASEPTGAEISADGTPLGRAPLRIELPVGEHDLSAKLDGWPEQHRALRLERGGAAAAAQFTFRNGRVKITSAPGGAQVFREGQPLGPTPLLIEEVPPGEVRYELRLAGHKPVAVDGKVEPEEQVFLAARLEKEVRPDANAPFTNSLGMKFVPLGGGLRMAAHETRVQDYDAFCSDTGRAREQPGFTQTATDPVVQVNWFDANAFCKWLTERERSAGLLDETQSYRLPTDQEWSAAAGLPHEEG
ncbi:MAG: bifunctional serine/threonine-protein kinase/formylglycine-generating enzyme family protein, partial [Chthoniobacterales bacterium]